MILTRAPGAASTSAGILSETVGQTASYSAIAARNCVIVMGVSAAFSVTS